MCGVASGVLRTPDSCCEAVVFGTERVSAEQGTVRVARLWLTDVAELRTVEALQRSGHDGGTWSREANEERSLETRIAPVVVEVDGLLPLLSTA